MNKKLIPILTLLLSLAPSGCHSAKSAENTQQPELKNVFFVTDAEPVAGANPYREVSILSSHSALLRMFNLKPGTLYVARWSLTDAQGIEKVNQKQSFTPLDPGWTIWCPYTPDHKSCKPGRWNWSVELDGVGRFSTEVSVLPPTPSQLEELAQYEQAREEALRAFANSWLGWSNTFLTTFVYKPEPNKKGATNDSGEVIELVQISGLRYSFSRNDLTEADRQNGLSYKGTATFIYNTYRRWTERTGWCEWLDNFSFVGTDGHAHAFNDSFGFYPASNLREPLNMSLTLEKKDGHWRVKTDRDDVFVNGKLVTPSDAVHNGFFLHQPKLDSVQKIAPTEGAQRVQERITGDEVRATPAEIDRNTISTMTMLRGRIL